MSAGIDTENPPPNPLDTDSPSPSSPSNWRQAFTTLIATRSALIQIEAKDAAGAVGKRAVVAISAVICVFFGWALLLTGGIPMLACASGLSWQTIAMILAGVHLLAAAILLGTLRKALPPAFQHTKAEFQKDRQWLENFQSHKKS